MRDYIYVYNDEHGTPYYVGKGRGLRKYHQNKHTCTVPPKENIQTFYCDNEEEAYETEMFLIEFFGRAQDGGLLQNVTLGGRGARGRVDSAETIRKRAEGCIEHFKTNEHPRALTYEITTPDGEMIIIRGIRKYARENNLFHNALVRVSKGKQEHHKGYRCRRI